MGGALKSKNTVKQKMTIFSFYSIRFKKNSLYMHFKKFLARFWRPPPGGARGQLPPLATPLQHKGIESSFHIIKTVLPHITHNKIFKAIQNKIVQNN